jgi:short-subunit dehydrogenase
MHKVLPKFRERHEGCVINIASRYSHIYLADSSAGTVNSPMNVQYSSGKAALIRAVGCLQEELDLDKEDNIHIYALHPGGVKTGLQSTPDLRLS